MYYGTNGENWFDAEDPISRQWVIDSVQPGQTFTLRFRADKPDFNPEDRFKLMSLAEDFENAGKHLSVIYCINVKDDAAVQFEYFVETKESGVDIIAVEFGNETYSKEQANFTFSTYLNWFTPIKGMIEQHYPTMKFLVFLAPRPKESGVLGGRRDHSNFNKAAIDYINITPNAHPTIHIYFNDRECPVAVASPAKVTFTPDTLFPELEQYYTDLYGQAMANMSLWDNTLSYLETSMSGKEVYITEWGFDNYGNIKNTLATGAVAWHVWTTYGRDSRITALLQHNGISKAGPGFIFPVHPTNDTSEPSGSANKRRVDYYLFKMFRTISDIQLAPSIIENPGTYVFISDLTGVDTATPIAVDPTSIKITSVTFDSLGGKYMYSSSGATEWMAKNSTASYEINEDVTEYPAGTNAVYYFMVTANVILAVNEPPVVEIDSIYTSINSDGTFNEGTSVRLEANASDVDGSIVKYTWISGTGTVIVSSSDATAITVTVNDGVNAYYLEVEDDKGLTAVTHVVLVGVPKPVEPCNKPWWCVFNPWHKRCKCNETT